MCPADTNERLDWGHSSSQFTGLFGNTGQFFAQKKWLPGTTEGT